MVLRLVLSTVAALLLAACSMTQSTLIDAVAEHSPDAVGRNAGRPLLQHTAHRLHGGHEEPSAVRCKSDLGAYYLSRSLLYVKLEQIAAADPRQDAQTNPALTPKSRDYAPPRSGAYRLTVQPQIIADRGKGYCLDYLASPTSNDQTSVTRTEDALLHEITSLADDQSVKIAEKVIDILFIGITGNPRYREQGLARADDDAEPTLPRTLVEVTYDPSVPMQAALLNDRLRDFGHCLILGENVPERKTDFQSYCNDPLGFLKRHRLDRTAFHEDRPKAKAAQQIAGIYYRPRRPYSYYIMTAEDRKLGIWKLHQTATVKLENDSPILVAGIDRNIFAKRRTRLTFDQGVLKHVAVDKTSELLAFVDVPLYFAEGLISVPAAMVRIDIDTAVAETNLIGAEMQLIQQRELTRTAQRNLLNRMQETGVRP